MANWHLEERMQTLGERRFPHYVFIGDNGVEIRMDLARGWFMEYHGPDLEAKFYIYPSSGRGDFDMALGPQCRVRMDPSKLSRPLTPKDYKPLAMNLKEVLREHFQFPGAVPPKIERVHFADSQLQPFDN